MRPRIVGVTAHLILAFNPDGVRVARTTDRVVRHGIAGEDIMETMPTWEFPNDLDLSTQIRPRISTETADVIQEQRQGDEPYTDVVDRLLYKSEWQGVDTDGFGDSGYGEPYVDSVKTFADWYDRERPPSAFDVQAWLEELSETYQESTVRRHYHGVKAYFKYEIGDWNEPMEPPTRDELLDELRRLADELGKTPTTRDVYGADDFPGIHYFQDEFGTWNEALKAAGFEPNEEKSGRYSDDELIEDLQDFAKEIGDVPTSTQMKDDGPHSTSTYITRFGSWSQALEAADLSVEDRYTETVEA